MKDLSYEEHQYNCGLTALETRRLSGDQIEVSGYEIIDRNVLDIVRYILYIFSLRRVGLEDMK